MSRGRTTAVPGRRTPKGVVPTAVLLVVVALAQGGAIYRLVLHPLGPPAFRKGGSFLTVAGQQASGRLPYTSDGVGTAPSSAPVPGADPSPPATGVSVPQRVPISASPPDGSGGSSPSAATPGLPAVGTYVYAVQGSESATLFGSRDYPSTMNLVLHDDDTVPGEIVADLTFSDQHQEREILTRTVEGVAFAFEGGQITFGPGTQTSEADYDPPMLQVATDAPPGTVINGTSEAKASDGSVTRTEDWTVTVVGNEDVTVGGAVVPTVVVDLHRQSRPGSSDQLTRDRRYWYDPAHSMWVKWHERFHGERSVGFGTFTYDTDYVATLTEFPT